MKHILTILAALTLVACGTEQEAPGVDTAVVAVESEAVDPNYDQDCLRGNTKPMVALPKAPIPFCKTLADGTVSSVTVQPGPDVVNGETCRISFEGKGLIETLRELQYDVCLVK